MILEDRVCAFRDLGDLFLNFETNNLFDTVIDIACKQNSWFTEHNIKYGLLALGNMLCASKIQQWMRSYTTTTTHKKKVGVIIPSNIPFVGFYDFLCVLLSCIDASNT